MFWMKSRVMIANVSLTLKNCRVSDALHKQLCFLPFLIIMFRLNTFLPLLFLFSNPSPYHHEHHYRLQMISNLLLTLLYSSPPRSFFSSAGCFSISFVALNKIAKRARRHQMNGIDGDERQLCVYLMISNRESLTWEM